MKLSNISIQRPVFAVVMSLLLIVLGIMSFTRLTLRELPNRDSMLAFHPRTAAKSLAKR